MVHLIWTSYYLKGLTSCHTLSPPNNVQHTQHFFLFFEHAKLIQIQASVFAIPDAWNMVFSFSSFRAQLKFHFLKMFPLAILAKVYSHSTLFITCTYFFHGIYAYLKLCIYLVLCIYIFLFT